MKQFVGGMRLPGASAGGSNLSRPLAVLTIDNDHLSIRPRWSWLSRVVGGIETPLTDGVEVERVSGAMPLLGGAGIRLYPHHQGTPVIFWCSKKAQRTILAELTKRGVTVRSQVATVL